MPGFNPHIIKEHPEIPDWYTVSISFIGNESKDYDVVGHKYINEFGILELFTKDELIIHISLTSIKECKFDKNFTKLNELKSKNEPQSKIL